MPSSKRNAPGNSRMRLCIPALAALLFLSGCGWFSHTPAPGRPAPGQGTVVDTVRSQIGVPYAYGGDAPDKGFDCSGLVKWAYSLHGVVLPRRAADQAAAGFHVSKGKLRPGDLVFFNTSRKKTSLHVGVFSGRNAFIHSPSSGGRVREDKLFAPYWKNTFYTARRIID